MTLANERFNLVALLVSRMSPSGIGTNASGDAHDVGVFGTSYMMSLLGRPSNSRSTCL